MREITGTGTGRRRRRRPRRGALRGAVAAGTFVLVAAGVAGCGDAETGTTGGDGAEPSTATEPSGYLETPEDVTLTDPGSELALGDGATIAWEPREGTTAVVDLVVDRIERTTVDASFQGWQIDAATAATTPYFVRATATNVSGDDLGGTPVLLWALDDAGTLVDRQRFSEQAFRPCPSADLPTPFADGSSADVCFVYLVAAGRTLDAVAFPPPAGLDPVLWRGKVSTRVQPPEPERTGGPAPGDRSGGDGDTRKREKKAGSTAEQ